jgi:hypothetical protein
MKRIYSLSVVLATMLLWGTPLFAAKLFDFKDALKIEAAIGKVAEDAGNALGKALADAGTATRIFAGPDEYPPADYAAYGIVAFRSTATEADTVRYSNICAAYVSTLPPSPKDSDKQKQMVTVWPVDDSTTAKKLNRLRTPTDICATALTHYNLSLSHHLIAAAKLQGENVDGVGPYLLAWSPTDKIGTDQAVILMADFSQAKTYEEAQRLMVAWVNDIESDPKFWQNGFTVDKVRLKIKSLVDRYGSEIEQAFRAKP